MFFEKEMFNEQIFPLLMKNPINESIKKILSRNYHIISDEHRLYLTQIMDVNEMFTLGLLNDEIFKNNIDKFDFSLISKYRTI